MAKMLGDRLLGNGYLDRAIDISISLLALFYGLLITVYCVIILLVLVMSAIGGLPELQYEFAIDWIFIWLRGSGIPNLFVEATGVVAAFVVLVGGLRRYLNELSKIWRWATG